MITVKITNTKLHHTRDGQEMMFLEVRQRYTVVVLPTLYHQAREFLCVGAVVVLQGYPCAGKIIATQLTRY